MQYIDNIVISTKTCYFLLYEPQSSILQNKIFENYFRARIQPAIKGDVLFVPEFNLRRTLLCKESPGS
jgi:hypothetical protein